MPPVKCYFVSFGRFEAFVKQFGLLTLAARLGDLFIYFGFSELLAHSFLEFPEEKRKGFG